jgi:ribulose-bisphosphate carboxylase large chain
MSYTKVTYLIESPYPIEEAVESLAGESSTGTFVAVPHETPELKAKYANQLLAIRPLESVATPSLMGSRLKGGRVATQYNRAEVDIGIPFAMSGTEITTLLSAMAGNIFELAEVSGLRLLDVEFAPEFAEAHPMPQFGIHGTREKMAVFNRPMIGTIIKPSVGLSPEQTAEIVRELAEAGIDFIKDDELLNSPDYSPVVRRAEVIMHTIHDVAQKTGKQVMYAFNISSDDVDQMLRSHDAILKLGGTCIMLNVNQVGVSAVKKVRQHAQLPIHGHRNGWGMLTRHPMLGFDFAVYQKIWRLAGVDHLHVNGIRNKFYEGDESVVHSIASCLKPIFNERDCLLPVISSGQWGGQAPDTYRLTQTIDLLYLAGGGIQGHPGGATDGVRAIKQAWQAAIDDISLDVYAQSHPELAQSLQKFGGRK